MGTMRATYSVLFRRRFAAIGRIFSARESVPGTIRFVGVFVAAMAANVFFLEPFLTRIGYQVPFEPMERVISVKFTSALTAHSMITFVMPLGQMGKLKDTKKRVLP